MGDRIGIIVVNHGLLEQLLRLPEGHRIRGLRLTDNFSDTFEIAVEGPSLPERLLPGDVIPRVTYTVTVSEVDELVPVRKFVGKFEETGA